MNIPWKDIAHYGVSSLALALAAITELGVQIPGVDVNPKVAGAVGLAALIAGFKGGVRAKAVIAFLAVCLLSAPVFAAGTIPTPTARPSTLTTTPSATTVAQNILATAPADIAYAIQLATAANTPASNVRKQCYQAIQAAIPTPPSGSTLPPGPDVVTHIEQAAELADTLNPSSPVFVNCAGAAMLAGQTVLSFVNALVTGIAGIAVLAPKL